MRSSVRFLTAVVCFVLVVFSTQYATARGPIECKRPMISDFAPFKSKAELEKYMPRQLVLPPPQAFKDPYSVSTEKKYNFLAKSKNYLKWTLFENGRLVVIVGGRLNARYKCDGGVSDYGLGRTRPGLAN